MGRIFYTCTALIGILLGVFLFLFIQPPLIWLGVFALGGCIGLLAAYRFQAKRAGALLLFVVMVCLGLARAKVDEHQVTPEQIDFYNGQKVTVEGLVTETDIRRDSAKYTITVGSPIGDPIGDPIGGKSEILSTKSEINPKTQDPNSKNKVIKNIQGKVLITLDKYPQYHYGDLVRVTGKLEAPGEFEGFSYDHYLSLSGIYSVMYKPRIELIRSGGGYLFWHVMGYLQDGFMSRINRIWPEPYASFEAGLLIGARKGIPPDLMNQFNITGLSHIIAISGFNITIIIAIVMGALAWMPRKRAFWVAVIAIVLFTLFVGASPSVVRASIMGILGLMALNFGRQNNIHLTVLYSAVFMILWNPKTLWWDTGFQLSFAAVLGLIYVAPHFERFFKYLPETLGIREALLMTCSAQVMAFPIIAYTFGRFSLIAPLANLLVAFAIPLAMLFGFLAVIFSLIFMPFGLVFGYITWGILFYIIFIVQLFAFFPFASVII